MSDEVEEKDGAETAAAKPTITIAEREGSETSAAKPTITIAEREETEAAAEETPAEPAADDSEDVHYQAVEKDGTVTAIWEMQGLKHLRTIDPRSVEGKQILALFETAA